MYNRLLVTLDGSDFARAALDEAMRVADGNSRVILSEVIDSIGQVIAQTTPVAFGVDASPDLTAAERAIETQIDAAEAHLKAARRPPPGWHLEHRDAHPRRPARPGDRQAGGR
ncbi:MAG TPA: universal stress protein [Dehalococcoidia bacterium]|jgi:nucleotide-binding universal stress UspA family protein|nr:universal stress protein [Dehalococcoidia bacterium]